MALTSKELSWLEDQMSLEQILANSYGAAEDEASDEAFRNKFKNYADRHQQHFNCLYKNLK